MNTIRLGKTGLMVSAVGFGGIPIQRLSEEEAVRVVRRALDLGVTFLDTAHGYTTSEERIGKAIAGRRDGLILATKSHALDAEGLPQEMAQSFQRLGVEHIDLFQFHGVSKAEDYERVVAPGGPLDVAREAQAAGRIGHIGVTSHSLDMALQLAACGHFETLMFPFNFITSEPAQRLVPLCQEQDVGFIAMKPIGGGLLEDANLALKWLRHFPGVVPLVGIEKAAEIEQVVSIMEGSAALAVSEWAEINRLKAELGTRFCRSCDYCQPCPQDIRISSMLRIRSFAKRMPPERVFGAWGQEMVAVAETCADCGDCESRCPYELPIREMLREHVAWFHAERARWPKPLAHKLR